MYVLLGIGATIRIGREIQCLPYAEFLFYLYPYWYKMDTKYSPIYLFPFNFKEFCNLFYICSLDHPSLILAWLHWSVCSIVAGLSPGSRVKNSILIPSQSRLHGPGREAQGEMDSWMNIGTTNVMHKVSYLQSIYFTLVRLDYVSFVTEGVKKHWAFGCFYRTWSWFFNVDTTFNLFENIDCSTDKMWIIFISLWKKLFCPPMKSFFEPWQVAKDSFISF